MENASKALMMAGGVLLTMLIVSLLLYAWTTYSDYTDSQYQVKAQQELTEFNVQYTSYNRDDVQGYELITLINRVIDYNQRYSEVFVDDLEEGETAYIDGVENIAKYSSVNLSIKLDENDSYDNRNKFLTTVKVPEGSGDSLTYTVYGVSDKGYKNSTGTEDIDRLFEKSTYEQSRTKNTLSKILSTTNEIENYFGGATNAQDVVKSRGTIFESKIIGDAYNGYPISFEGNSNWYEASYVINRYKTLTKKNETIAEIRSEANITKVLQYYEFMEFKKAEFKCTGITYNPNTGRIKSMTFVIK